MATVVHHARPTGWVHRAWWSLLLFVPSFAASFLVGEAVAAACGHPTLEVDQPAWVGVVSGVPAFAVFAAPLLLTRWLAGRAGETPHARAPVLAAIFVVMFFLAQSLLGWIDGLG